MSKFYLTTAIPYVNARPHIGHALEYVQADAIRRFYQLQGREVRLISGADENALKNVRAAQKANVDIQTFLDRNAAAFRQFYADLGVQLAEFRRGTDQQKHWPGVWELWKRCDAAGDIYQETYSGLYCVGCEQFYLPPDLVDGKCPVHLSVPELIEEKNYFFKLSRYASQLEKLIASDTLKIIPQIRKNEVLAFIRQGLEDFSISRSNERAAGVGVPVPDDDSQKIYVWFDALAIYLTASGWGYDQRLFKKWWPADLHIIGKDIIRFHCVYWPAMLLSAELDLPKAIFSHGFITSGGQKMSKTLGNVIDPYDLITTYGVDALRYFLLREIPTASDGDLTFKRFTEVYLADLANGLGNLVSRVAKLAQLKGVSSSPSSPSSSSYPAIISHLEAYEFNLAIAVLWQEFSALDAKINADKPWEKSGREAESLIAHYILRLVNLATPLAIFLPGTAEKIRRIFIGPKITLPRPLFPRL